MNVALVGLGQIGGSIARAIVTSTSEPGQERVTAWTPSGHGPAAAARDGIVAARTLSAAIDGADLIILAAPPLDCLELLDELAGPLRGAIEADAVITDVASTKAQIVGRADGLGLRFVGGHPMAGRETSGYGAADPELFRGRPWLVVAGEHADEPAIRRVEALAVRCGAMPTRLSAAEHDAAAALVSHAPLVVSVALVEALTAAAGWSVAARIAAGGWAGMTRLARTDAAMGAGILATNAAPTADALRAVRAALDGWIATLDGEPSADALTDRLRSAAERLGAQS